jgi:hypothetical protein
MIQRLFLPMTLLFMIIVTAAACRRSSTSPGISGVTGELVENPGCGHYVVRLLSGPTTDSTVALPSWTDTATHTTFANVFMVRNWVHFQQANLSVGDTFTFTLNGPDPEANSIYHTCAVFFYNMPSDSDVVTNIQKISSPHN